MLTSSLVCLAQKGTYSSGSFRYLEGDLVIYNGQKALLALQLATIVILLW